MVIRVMRVLIQKTFHLDNQRTVRIKRYLIQNFLKTIKI